MKIRIDHYITDTNINIFELLKKYMDIGFVSDLDSTVKHEPGLRTGFLYLGPKPGTDYIEFLSVENAESYKAAQEKGREDSRVGELIPYGVGVRVKNIEALHKELTEQKVAVKDVFSKRPEGKDESTPFVWSFMDLENSKAKLNSFYVEYLLSSTEKQISGYKLVEGKNGIYALAGLLCEFASEQDAYEALKQDFPESSLHIKSDKLKLGCHEIISLSKEKIRKTCVENNHKYPNFNEDLNLNGILLYTENLDKTEEHFKGKWKPYFRVENEIWILPSEIEGLFAVIQEKPKSEYLESRSKEEFGF